MPSRCLDHRLSGDPTKVNQVMKNNRQAGKGGSTKKAAKQAPVVFQMAEGVQMGEAPGVDLGTAIEYGKVWLKFPMTQSEHRVYKRMADACDMRLDRFLLQAVALGVSRREMSPSGHPEMLIGIQPEVEEAMRYLGSVYFKNGTSTAEVAGEVLKHAVANLDVFCEMIKKFIGYCEAEGFNTSKEAMRTYLDAKMRGRLNARVNRQAV